MRDSFNREISYLRISVTDRCNLRCEYCSAGDSGRCEARTPLLDDTTILSVVTAAAQIGITKIRLTGGEPLLRPGILELIRAVASTPGIEETVMTSNGVLLSRYATDLAAAGLRRVNVSLDSLDPERYAALTGGGRVEAALEGIDAAIEAGIRVKLNVVSDEYADKRDVAAIREFARERGVGFQLINRFRLDVQKGYSPDYDRPPPCGECNRLRLLSSGVLKPCLHSNIEVEVDPENPLSSLEEAIRRKPLEGGVCTNRNMVEIGG